MPPQAMPLPSSSQTNILRHVSTRISPRGWAWKRRQAAIMKNFMEMTVASHAEACSTGAQNIEASEKMTASSGMVTRAESSFLHEHRQQLVLELRLQDRALGETGAQLADVRLHAPRAGPWRAVGAEAGWCRCRRCIVSLARAPGRCQIRHARRLDSARTGKVLRQIPKFALNVRLVSASCRGEIDGQGGSLLARPTRLLYQC